MTCPPTISRGQGPLCRPAAPANPPVKGFTLLELVLAMALLSLLVGMVFGTAKSSLALGHAVVESQNEEMLKQAFFDLLNQRFSTLPGNTRFDLKVQDSGTQYLSDLTLQNVPLSFNWGGQSLVAKAVQLSTVRRRSGYLDIVLRYYQNEILQNSESAESGTTVLDNQPFAEITLLTDVAYFEWRVLDGRTMEWQYDWDLQGRSPLQLELTLAFGAQGEEMRQVFWVPPRQNPETIMRQLQVSGNSSSGRGNQNGNGDDDDNTSGPGQGNGGQDTPPPGVTNPTPTE